MFRFIFRFVLTADCINAVGTLGKKDRNRADPAPVFFYLLPKYSLFGIAYSDIVTAK